MMNNNEIDLDKVQYNIGKIAFLRLFLKVYPLENQKQITALIEKVLEITQDTRSKINNDLKAPETSLEKRYIEFLSDKEFLKIIFTIEQISILNVELKKIIKNENSEYPQEDIIYSINGELSKLEKQINEYLKRQS